MRLPKPQQSAFKYQTLLLLIILQYNLFKYLPDGLLDDLDINEKDSLFATMIVNNDFIIKNEPRTNK